MSAQIQTIVALVIVGLAVGWLVLAAIRRRKAPGCGSEDCGAVSPEIKSLQKKLRKG